MGRGGASDEEVTAEEAARRFGITVSTFDHWRKKQGLKPTRKAGQRNLYRLSDVQMFFDASIGARGLDPDDAALEAGIKAEAPSQKQALTELYTADQLMALSGDDLKDALTRARALREGYVAHAARLRAEQQEGLLVEITDVTAMCYGFFAVVKAKLEGLPSGLADRLSVSATPQAIETDLRDWARIALEDLKRELGAYSEDRS